MLSLLSFSVVIPGLPTPTVSFENVTYNQDTNTTSVRILVSAVDSPIYYLTFNGTMTAWSLSDAVPQRGHMYSGSYFVEDGYGILRRSLEGLFIFEADFEGQGSLLFRLFTTYYVHSPIQEDVAKDLPDWTQIKYDFCFFLLFPLLLSPPTHSFVSVSGLVSVAAR